MSDNISATIDIPKSRFIKPCGMTSDNAPLDPVTIVIFGGGGDLSRRKLIPTIYHLFKENLLPDDFSVIGFGSPPDGDDVSYRERIVHSMKEFESGLYDKERFDTFLNHVFFEGGYFDDISKYENLKKRLSRSPGHNVIYYMSVHPSFLPQIINNIKSCSLNDINYNPRIVVEKPFGTDQKSALELNSLLHSCFEENRIFRIDHYLGKETVQNIIYLRFANIIFEPLWNRNHIDSVQITVAEDIGVEHRGKFYEQAGVVRDIVQNHILQLMAFIAMEPPVGFDADAIRDEKVKVFNSIRMIDDEYVYKNCVQGQYGPGTIGGQKVSGYRDEFRVASDSKTPTFFAAKMFIDNWRWADVPFYVRTGKRLPKRCTEVIICFKRPPLKIFGTACDDIEQSLLRIRIQPNEQISFYTNVKYPNDAYRMSRVSMNFDYKDYFKEKNYPPYSRLILDCLKGDLTLFVREDSIKALWSIVDPVINKLESSEYTCPNYSAGDWGPVEADDLLKRDGRSWYTD
ncbi:MAG: glucose-6-phosphate dehydrogenase [Spirochaetes bacterium]|nr:glucose-6-phosphate dehydrogenase [Spirochaetota bacterium]MBN2769965.1 glucose-6-phosphate dehydrogenase [Spirochaetota bacterium]